MATLDVFNDDAFSMTELTSAIDILPHAPARLGSMGLFNDKPIMTTVAMVEERNGRLALIPSQARGSTENVRSRRKRSVRSFSVPHFPLDQVIRADDLINVRSFGNENEVEMVSQVVNDELSELKPQHEVTHEHLRSGAIQGIILDSDGVTVLYNLFTEFNITEATETFDLETDAFAVRTACTSVIRKIESALGATPYRMVHVMCGDNFWDELVSHPEVKAAYDRWNEGEWLRGQMQGEAQGFEYGGIKFERYRAKVGTRNFIDVNQARAFPVGVSDMFYDILAPADMMEAVGTRGKRYYAKQERLQLDKGVRLHTQSNVLSICTRPGALVKLSLATGGSGSGSGS